MEPIYYSREDINEILELDTRRTQGTWVEELADPDEPIIYVEDTDQYICQTTYDHQSVTYRQDPQGHIHDAKFIAAAPRMAAIIRQLLADASMP